MIHAISVYLAQIARELIDAIKEEYAGEFDAPKANVDLAGEIIFIN